MAKETKQKTAHVRAPRPKNAAFYAKRDRNIAAYEARNKRLAEERAAEKLRKEQEAAQAASEEAAKAAVEEYQNRYVEAALNGPNGLGLRRWLKNRVATFDRVSRFFAERPDMVHSLENAA